MFSQFFKATSHSQTPAPSVRIDGRNLVEAFVNRCRLTPEGRLYLVKRDGAYRPIFWHEFQRTVRGVTAGLKRHGIQRGDKVAILSNCRPEWTAADLGIMSLGAISVPIYQSSTAEDIEFFLRHSEASLIFVENASQAAKVAALSSKLDKAIAIIAFDANKTEVEAWESFVADPVSEAEFHKLASEIDSEDIASIVYTSGTTGQPKGALLAHSCLAAVLRSIVAEVHLTSNDTTLTFLPFAHVLGRIESLLPIYSGITLGFAESFNAVASNLVDLKPTLMMAVPRVFEKLQSSIANNVKSLPKWNRQLFFWAENVGRQVARARAEKKDIPLTLQAKHKLADQLVFSKVRARLGGRLRLAVSGGAPISPELCEFFHACGVSLLEGYGLTETASAIVVNRPDDFRFGTVGKPLAETEFKIAPDGEILVRGPAIFKGYYKNKEASAEVLSKDGWFATGDIGEIDNRGFVRITDRKKELIVTSGGKNVAPAKLENRLKEIPYISNALVFGDKQKYLVALLTPNDAALKQWAQTNGVSATSEEILRTDKRLISEIEREVKRINSGLASYESIKKFEILPHDFTIESGELTPSLKIKRKVCIERYRNHIDSMYQ